MQAVACRFFPTPATPSPANKRAVWTSSFSSTPRIVPSATPATGILHRPTGDPAKELDDSIETASRDYNSLFVSQRSETVDPILLRTVEGEVPANFPRGTYYLAGPGIFSDDHGSTVHPLDGHGYLRTFDFDGEEVRFSARYVATQAQREERDERSGKWRFTHRGPFSVLRGGKKVGNVKAMKNVANTNVLWWGQRLLCLWEGGDPYEIDPQTLDTVGLFDMIGEREDRTVRDWWRPFPRGGAGLIAGLGVDVAAMFLKPILYGVFNMPRKRLLSHYKIDARRSRLLVLSCNAEDMLLPRSNFTFYEFDANFKLLQKKDFSIADHFLIHDWSFTDNHYVLFGNRIKLDIPGSMLAISGLSPMISALAVNPSRPTTPIYFLPRFSDGSIDGSRDWRVPIEAPSQLWVSHVCNAYEQKDATGNLEFELQASVCSYQWFNFKKMFGYNWKTGDLDPSFMNLREGRESLLPHLVKVAIRLDAEGKCSECSIDHAMNKWSKPADFPTINPAFSGQKHNYTYVGTTSGSRRLLPHFPFDSVAKFDSSNDSVVMWSTGSRKFIGEPIFVPRGVDEDDGYILIVEYAVSKKRCYLVILDAKQIGGADAVIAKLEVPKHLNFPLGFHGFWANI